MATFAASFYNFRKRTNSTERPKSSDLLYSTSIALKAGSSIVNPTIEIAESQSFKNVVSVNYCHIPKFNRYYFVNNIVYERGIWTLSLSVDVLATYKSEIGGDKRYILRSSAEYDGTIQDLMYPTKAKCSYQIDTEEIWESSISKGVYIVSTLSKDGEGLGAMKLWAFTPSQMATFNDKLFSSIDTDFGGTLINKIVNPSQYIKRCVWYPFDISTLKSLVSQEGIFVGNKGIPSTPCSSVGNKKWQFMGSLKLSASKMHPKAARGAYMNRPPFAHYTLFIPPFGVVPFEIVGASEAYANFTITVDLLTSAAELQVITGDGKQTVLTANVGVDVPLAQMNDTALERYGNMATQLVGGAVAATTGDVVGLFGVTASTIGQTFSAWDNAIPIGTMGGNMNAYRDAYLQAMYLDVADENVNNNGRPLCALKTIEDIPGFIQCGNGYTRISGTAEEYDQVNKLMKEGFYFA